MKKFTLQLLVLAAITIWGAVATLPDNNLHVVFCDVGQGDATLISYKTYQILVDAGPDNRVLECLTRHMPFYDRTLEALVITHDQAPPSPRRCPHPSSRNQLSTPAPLVHLLD